MQLGRDRRPARGKQFLALLVVVALGWIGLSLRVGAPPTLEIQPQLPGIGPRTPVTVQAAAAGRGLAGLTVEVEQGANRAVLAEVEHTPRPYWAFWGSHQTDDSLTVEVGRETIEWLEPGELTLRVTAPRADTWLRHPDPVVSETVLPVRLKPPSIQVLSTAVYLDQGGSALVRYRVDETATRDGVEVGSYWFPGYPLGEAAGERFALLAAPFDLDDPSQVRLVATDGLGNTLHLSFLTRYRPRPPRQSTIRLSDSFMEKVVNEITAQSGLQKANTLLDSYLAINRDLRRQNDAFWLELAASSRPEWLWRRPFAQQPNTQVMDRFAASRDYVYEGQVVDHQTHLGYDLASRRHDEIIASNRGVIAHAAYTGIYGNAVAVDHGYGLMTLYGHLSSIAVNKGDTVERGQVLGRSGETGLAGGDHLHFTMLVQGVPVDPVEWWDGKWIQNHIVDQLPLFDFER